MKKQKSGISLIVLVITIIVIIILAVAVILSIANNNPIENSKEAKFKSDLKTMQEELELIKSSNYVDNNGTGYGEVAITDLKSASNYTDDFEVKDGSLYIASKNTLTSEEKIWANELGVTEAPIKLGDEITYQGESFYVIGGDGVGKSISTDTQDILLLAKYNLTIDGTLKQDTTGAQNICDFSSTNYWSSVSEITYPADLNDEEKYSIPKGKTSIITKAKAYGSSLGAKEGRLMTYDEAKELKTVNLDILYGTKDGKKLNYWLGTVSSEYGIWHVNGKYDNLDDYVYYYDEEDNNYGGIRPVIKVSKSLVQ